MQLECWWSGLTKPSDTWRSLETAQLYCQQTDTTSEGRSGFPTTTFLFFFFFRFDYLVRRWSCITLLKNNQISISSEMVGVLFMRYLKKNRFWPEARRQYRSSTNTLACPCPVAVRWRRLWSDSGTGNRASNCSKETGHVYIMPSCPLCLAFYLQKQTSGNLLLVANLDKAYSSIKSLYVQICNNFG